VQIPTIENHYKSPNAAGFWSWLDANDARDGFVGGVREVGVPEDGVNRRGRVAALQHVVNCVQMASDDVKDTIG
jgi:hypothetical protein